MCGIAKLHTFTFTQLDDEPCIVIYDLRETQDGTEFTTAFEITSYVKTEKHIKQSGEFVINTLKAFMKQKELRFVSKFVPYMCSLTKPFT